MKHWLFAIVLAAGAVPLAGCAHGMAGSPVRYCTVTMGHDRGTAAYKSCMNEQLMALRVQGDAQKRAMLEALAVGAAAYGEARSERPQTSYPERARMVMCPDGRWAVGSRCVLLPDGRWAGVP